MQNREVWTPTTWQKYPREQGVEYGTPDDLAKVLEVIAGYPPLVTVEEIGNLRRRLAEAQAGRSFLLQGGDCAERFQDCSQEAILGKVKILLQMAAIISISAKIPVVRVGRIAGQYAKPRSQLLETLASGAQVLSFRGENVNSPDPRARQPQVKRLLLGHHLAAFTSNYVRALMGSGFADWRAAEHWTLPWFGQGEMRARYDQTVAEVQAAIAMMDATAFGISCRQSPEFYNSHEGLLLELEGVLTRQVGGKFYNLGAHMLWLGHRTRGLWGAHAEYFRGIANPVGVKVGPGADPGEMVALFRLLNPENEAGKLCAITRYGADVVSRELPALIEAVKAAKLEVCWVCDPMHGNGMRTQAGMKTRDFGRILAELREAFAIHRRLGSVLGGVHFELSARPVRECLGGAEGIRVEDLSAEKFESFCDPRLNCSQSLEMACILAGLLIDG